MTKLKEVIIFSLHDQVPAFRCELKVSGLVPGEKYVFAVAAYTAEGKLIGGSVGESSKPILASHPLPFLLAWAYVSQVGIVGNTSDVSFFPLVVFFLYI